MVKIVLIILIVITSTLVMINYFQVRKMISVAPKSIYPLFIDEWGNIYTRRGRIEKPSFQMKGWKQKRIFLVILGLITVLSLVSIFYYWEVVTWANIMLLGVIQLNYLTNVKSASFFVVENGFYYDEDFFEWADVKTFSIAPVTLGSEGYGMFENSTSYMEIKIYLDKSGKSRLIYIEDTSAVERLRSIFLKKGWQEN